MSHLVLVTGFTLFPPPSSPQAQGQGHALLGFLFPDPTGKQYMLHNEWTNGFHGSYALQMFKEKFF